MEQIGLAQGHIEQLLITIFQHRSTGCNSWPGKVSQPLETVRHGVADWIERDELDLVKVVGAVVAADHHHPMAGGILAGNEAKQKKREE